MVWDFDFESDTPLYIQLRNLVVLSISKGELQAGDKLPTVRALSDESGINTMTISKAYQLLKTEGYVQTDRRSGTVVSKNSIKYKFSEETKKQLVLIFSEMKVNGFSNSEIIEICKNILEEE